MTSGRLPTRNVDNLKINHNEQGQQRAKDVKADEAFMERMREFGGVKEGLRKEGVRTEPSTEHPIRRSSPAAVPGIQSSGGLW